MTAIKKYGPKNGLSYLANAQAKWGADLPDWVEALARQADRDGNQFRTMQKCGFDNAAAVSGVINRTYPGKLDKLEGFVRGALMHETVSCPILGTIGRNACVANQGLKFSAANPQRARLANACPRCPNAIGGGKNAER